MARLFRKSSENNLWKKSLIFLKNDPKNHRFSILLKIHENPDLGDVQIGTTDSKINIFSKLKKKLEKLSLDLSFEIDIKKSVN